MTRAASPKCYQGQHQDQHQHQPGPLFRAVAVLVCLAGLALLFEISLVDLDRLAHHLWTRASSSSSSSLYKQPSFAFEPPEEAVGIPAVEFGAEWMFQNSESVEVPPNDLLHLSLLYAACVENHESVVPWTFGAPGTDQENEDANRQQLVNEDDADLLEMLSECPAVDIYMPAGLRGHRYCEDASAYAKFLKSRLLPRWALDKPLFDRKLDKHVTYLELCPQTPLIFLSHCWDDVQRSPLWPESKPVYLTPNIEMYELNEQQLWHVDAVLCKTKLCEQKLAQWYAQEGNPRNASVFYTRHTSSDVAGFARHALGVHTIRPKDFENARFIHTAGTSVHKGTRQVLDCWLSRPDFPRLNLFINDDTYRGIFNTDDDARIRAAGNINLTTSRVDTLALGKAIAEAAFFLCTSRMEGYGHYINQARASGGVIVTPDVPPMNELISSSDMGVYVDTARVKDSNMFLSGTSTAVHALRDDVDSGYTAALSADAVCRAAEKVLLDTSAQQRDKMAVAARRQYHLDTAFFGRAMRELAQFAGKQKNRGL